jgi:hypothetical protein
MVSGLAALMLAKNPALKPAEVANVIHNTCQPLSQHWNCVGAGLIDCLEAVKKA